MRQSIPAAQGPRPGFCVFLPSIANSRGWGVLWCHIPGRGDEKRGQRPCPPSTLQHFLLIAQSNTAVFKHFNIFNTNQKNVDSRR